MHTLSTIHTRADVLKDVLELVELERPAWKARSRAIPAWHPRAEDPPEPDPKDDPKADPPKDDPKADPPEEDEAVTAAKAEAEAARKAAAAANREVKRLKDAQAETERKAKAEAGDFKALYEEEKARADKLEADTASAATKALVRSALGTAKAHNVETALATLVGNGALEGVSDEADAERIVKRLAKSDEYLFAKATTRQKRGAGGTREEEDPDDPKRPKAPVNRLRRGLEATAGT
jgi:hypothetical protein